MLILIRKVWDLYLSAGNITDFLTIPDTFRCEETLGLTAILYTLELGVELQGE